MGEIFSVIENFNARYYVDYNNKDDNGNSDKFIANIINMPLKEYQKLLQKYGAFPIKYTVFGEERAEFYFVHESDCKKVCDYLNEVYGTMFKLAGD